MVNLTDRIDILIRILFGLAIALGCYFVVRPFLTAITIAAIVTVVSWPLFLRFKNSLGNRPTPAAFFMVMLLVDVSLRERLLLETLSDVPADTATSS